MLPPPLPYARTAREVELHEAGIPRVFRRMMLSAPSSPTVGEETRLERPALGLVSVFLPCLALGISAALTRARPRRQRPVARAGDHAGRSLAGAGRGGVRLHAPLPAARALVNVGFGAPLWWSGALVASYGCTWVFMAMACLVAILVAGVVAFWVCLARAYG